MRPSVRASTVAGAFLALAVPHFAFAETDPLRDPAVRRVREAFPIERMALFEAPSPRAIRGATCADSAFQGLVWCATGTGYETAEGGTYTKTFGYNLDAAGRVVYLILTRREFPLAREKFDETLKALGARYGRPPTTLTFQGKTAEGDEFSSLIVYWGDIKLVRLSDAELRTVADGRTLGRGHLVDHRQDVRASARQRDPVYRIDGAAGFIAELRSLTDVRTDYVLRAVYAPAFAEDQAPKPEAKPRPPALDPGFAEALRQKQEEDNRRATLERPRQLEEVREAAEDQVRREEAERKAAEERRAAEARAAAERKDAAERAEAARKAAEEKARREAEERKAAEERARREAEERKAAEERARREAAERSAAAEKVRREEAARKAAEERRAAEERLLAEQRAQRAEAERRAVEERRLAEERARREEAERKIAEERRAAEDRRAEAERRRLVQERARLEEVERRAAAERRAVEERARRAEAEYRASLERAQRAEAERKAAEQRALQAERDRKAAEERTHRIDAERKAVEERRAEELQAQERRAAEERVRREEAERKTADERRAEDERRPAEERRAEERKPAAERRDGAERNTALARPADPAPRAEVPPKTATDAPSPGPAPRATDESKIAAALPPGVGGPGAHSRELSREDWLRMAVAQSRTSAIGWTFERGRDPISEDLVLRARTVFPGDAALEIAFECNLGAGKRLAAHLRAVDERTKAAIKIPAEDGRTSVVRGSVYLDEEAPQTAFLFPERGEQQTSIVEIPLTHDDNRKNTPRAEAWLRHYRVILKVRTDQGEVAATIFPYAENLRRVLEACAP